MFSKKIRHKSTTLNRYQKLPEYLRPGSHMSQQSLTVMKKKRDGVDLETSQEFVVITRSLASQSLSMQLLAMC